MKLFPLVTYVANVNKLTRICEVQNKSPTRDHNLIVFESIYSYMKYTFLENKFFTL